MRVIAGTARGCLLETPKGLHTRPTADRMKENLFNILAPYLPGARFLDLFSGSGAIGIEALSRGAREAVFAEQSPAALHCIEKNLQKTRLAERAKVLPFPVARAIPWLFGASRHFDLAFMDPPYAGPEAAEACRWLEKTPILAEGGLLVIERSSRGEGLSMSAWTLIKSRTYGATRFDMYNKEGVAADDGGFPRQF